MKLAKVFVLTIQLLLFVAVPAIAQQEGEGPNEAAKCLSVMVRQHPLHLFSTELVFLASRSNQDSNQGQVLAIDLLLSLSRGPTDSSTESLAILKDLNLPLNSSALAKSVELDRPKFARVIDKNSSSDLSEEARRVLDKAELLAKEEGESLIHPRHIVLAILSETPESLHGYFERTGVSIERARRLAKGFVRYDKSITDAVESIVKAGYGTDLTDLARQDKFRHLRGRASEIQQLVEKMSLVEKNGAVLVGHPGVGKTAVVEAFAQKIVDGEVPPHLKGSVVLSLDVGNLIAGTKYRGEFEERISNIIRLVRNTNGKVILFVDEVHQSSGAGSAEGSADMMQLLKTPISNGFIKFIGGTTLEEYRKYIEKDRAFSRRLSMLRVDPPSEQESVDLLRDRVPRLTSKFPKVKLADGVVELAVRWAVRYLSDQHLPDSAISLLDGAIAAKGTSGDKDQTVTEATLAQQLEKLGRGNFSRIMGTDTTYSIANLEGFLKSKVIGQDQAAKPVASAIRRAKAGINNPNRPLGSFLFVGPTGVGKTEEARALSEFLGTDKNSFIKIDMSEFQEKHSVSKMIGAPPGYVGHEEAGRLTEFVRRNPTSVVLLDEIEKAHPEVLLVLLQVMDDGVLTDGQGRTVSFKNVVLIMTSNIGASKIVKTRRAIGFSDRSGTVAVEVNQELKASFPPEFLNRIDEIVTFEPLEHGDMLPIVNLRLADLFKRMKTEKKIEVVATSAAVDWLAVAGYSAEYGARPLNRVIQKNVEDQLADLIILGQIKEGDSVVVDSDGLNIVVKRR